nr:hypothetical protein [Kibdelosporangium sp. MJ126-NF4]CTQ93051.1 hypothetical protein [Kibdelosporangium sp. MJ126-NF4]
MRRRDLHQPVMVTGEVPAVHGANNDPRYPSKRALRMILSFLIDLAVHIGVPVGVAYALDMREPGLTSGQFGMVCVLGFLALSILDRIFLQWAARVTVGKVVTALRTIREDTGGRPTFGMLVKAWLWGIFAAISALG